MTDDRELPFIFPAVSRKKVTAAFDGGRLTSDSGVMLLSLAAEDRCLVLVPSNASISGDLESDKHHAVTSQSIHRSMDAL